MGQAGAHHEVAATFAPATRRVSARGCPASSAAATSSSDRRASTRAPARRRYPNDPNDDWRGAVGPGD
jgi:hypothetical protein